MRYDTLAFLNLHQHRTVKRNKTIDLKEVPIKWIADITKNSLYSGLFLGSWYTITQHHTLDFPILARHMLRFGVPFASIGATYASCTYIAQEITQRDTKYNHLFGSICAASVAQAFWKNLHYSLFIGYVIGFVSIVGQGMRKYDWGYYFHSDALTFGPLGMHTLDDIPDFSRTPERREWTL